MSILKSLAVGWMLLVGAWAQAQVPVPPEVAARSYLLLDVTAKQVLAAKEIDVPVEPAALTQLMTAYLVFDALKARKLDLKQTLPVSTRAWKMPGARMFIDTTMQVAVDDLLKGMIVQSANDATMALAEGVGGSAERFVQMMNDQARLLGMKSTGFKNPEGQTEAGHTSTARDLGVLATRLLTDFPEAVGYYATKKYRYPGAPVANETSRNLLMLRDPSVDGLQIGYTEAAGYCMVATASREFPNLASTRASDLAARGGRRLVAVVVGVESENARANEAQKLLNWGFTAFEAVKLFDAGQAVSSSTVWKGTVSKVGMGKAQPVVVAIPTGSVSRLKTQVVRSEPLLAPIADGQVLGALKVYSGDVLVTEMPLQALESVEQAGIFGRAWDAVRMWIR